MPGDWKAKTQSDNAALANQTSAQYVHIDGTKTPVVVPTNARRALRVVIATKGVAFTVRNGSRVIGNFGTATPEGTYNLGVYCENGIIVDGVSGTGSAMLAFEK